MVLVIQPLYVRTDLPNQFASTTPGNDDLLEILRIRLAVSLAGECLQYLLNGTANILRRSHDCDTPLACSLEYRWIG